jgi:hypothetical protein
MPLLLLQAQQALALQVLHDLPHTVLHALQVAPDVDLRLLRCLVRRADARELWNLALSRLLVQTLGVARLGNLERDVDEDLDESEGLVRACGHGVQIAGCGAVGFVWRDEGRDGNCGRVGKQLGDLGKVMLVSSSLRVYRWRAQASRLRHARASQIHSLLLSA